MVLTTVRRGSDQRGIALQTAIILTAMVAIAVTVSAVIYTRGGEVADDLQRQQVTFDPARIQNPDVCDRVTGYEWDPLIGECVKS